MQKREDFLKSSLAAAAGISLLGTSATPTPNPGPTPFPYDVCVKNPALPYDRPIDIAMQALDAPDFHLVAYRDHPVLLNIFATWCGPCNEEMPSLIAAANSYYDRGLRVIGINYAEPDDTVRSFRKKYAIPYPIAMDRDGRFTNALQRGKASVDLLFPVTLFITPSGFLYCDAHGAMSKREQIYRIEKFLGATKSVPPLPEISVFD
ncbi:MAG: TlpA family protein disulfide reductase [Candidatus Eremiobacteraeota bacterium]|nr:TlpA family protein disulfide reductase [Candidatus Eremiobacteraeota bacterium]